MIVKEKILVEKVAAQQNIFLKFIDGNSFDKTLEKVTTFLFRVILYIGIPYFFYIMKDFFF